MRSERAAGGPRHGPPLAGVRRDRSRPLPSLARRVAAVVVGLVALAGPAAGAGPSQAAPPGRPAPALALAGQTPWVTAEGTYAVELRVTGAPPGAAVDLVVHDYVESRSQFRDALDGDLGTTAERIAAVPLTSLRTSAAGTVQVGFRPADQVGGRGVYPVEVRLLDADRRPVATVVTFLSYFTEEDAQFPPLEVAVLVDIAAPPALDPEGGYEMSDQALAALRQRLAAVQRAPGVPVTLAPRPETLEGLVGAGGGESGDVDDLRALAVGREVLARPFVDVDLASLRDAGLLAEANQQAEVGADVVRSRLGVEPVGGIWLPGSTWGAAGARQAVDLGIPRAVVAPTAVAGSGTGRPVPLAPVHLGGEGGPVAMVADDELASRLTAGGGMLAAHRFLAELAIAWREAPSERRGVVVHLPASGAIEPAVVGAALAGLVGGPAVRAVPLTQLFADVPVGSDRRTSVDLVAHQGPDLRPVAGPLTSVRDRVGGVGALLHDPALGAGLEHSVLLSTGTATPDELRLRYLARADEALDMVSGAVTLPDAFRITLTARRSTIPVAVTNDLDQEIAVRVRLEGDQLEFPEGPIIDRVLPPGTTRLEVPVRTRTSGAFTLDVQVTSPDETILLDRSTFDIRSTAISGVGLVLSIGAGLFLVVWWARNWRSTRRGRGGDRPDRVPATPAAPVDVPPPSTVGENPDRHPGTAGEAPIQASTATDDGEAREHRAEDGGGCHHPAHMAVPHPARHPAAGSSRQPPDHGGSS